MRHPLSRVNKTGYFQYYYLVMLLLLFTLGIVYMYGSYLRAGHAWQTVVQLQDKIDNARRANEERMKMCGISESDGQPPMYNTGMVPYLFVAENDMVHIAGIRRFVHVLRKTLHAPLPLDGVVVIVGGVEAIYTAAYAGALGARVLLILTVDEFSELSSDTKLCVNGQKETVRVESCSGIEGETGMCVAEMLSAVNERVDAIVFHNSEYTQSIVRECMDAWQEGGAGIPRKVVFECDAVKSQQYGLENMFETWIQLSKEMQCEFQPEGQWWGLLDLPSFQRAVFATCADEVFLFQCIDR